jgi:hypothetical protein
MAFEEGEHTVIGTLPAQGWQVGSVSCFEGCGTFGFEPVIGFLIVRLDHALGRFEVVSYPLTCEGAQTERDDQVFKSPNGTVWMEGDGFSTEEECQAFLRKTKAVKAGAAE